MRHYSNDDLTWRDDRLHLGRRALDVSVVRDTAHPTMWRIRVGTKLSDMVNRTRARDAAELTALALLNRQESPTAAVLAA